MPDQTSLSRRRFLSGALGAGAGAALFSIVPARAQGGRPAPSNRLTLGCIGLGGMGNANLGGFLGHADCQVVAVADVDRHHLEAARRRVDGHYRTQGCRAYGDFRELVARDDIDMVMIATPDHWHAIPAIMAASSGKDIYGEKPFSHTLSEGRHMADAVRRYNRIWQTGSWQRSGGGPFRQACGLVRNGRLGKVVRIEVGLPASGVSGPVKFGEPPPELDYEFWIGPARWAPYTPKRVHFDWRWQLDYGGGGLMDWVGHHVDIAHWGMGWDHTGPVSIEGHADWPREGIWDAPTRYRYTARYSDGTEMVVASYGVAGGTKWIGERGDWVWVNRGGMDAQPKSLLQERIGPDEHPLYLSTNHIRNFLDCVKSRAEAITPAETAHRSASVGHLGLIAMTVGRRLRWDPEREVILDDPGASRLLGKAMRPPWHR